MEANRLAVTLIPAFGPQVTSRDIWTLIQAYVYVFSNFLLYLSFNVATAYNRK